jgi:hypothetical protein
MSVRFFLTQIYENQILGQTFDGEHSRFVDISRSGSDTSIGHIDNSPGTFGGCIHPAEEAY